LSFKTFILILIIVVSGLFIYLKMQSLGDEQSYFNQRTRFTLGKYGWVRTILGLQKDGDARAHYLLGDSVITVEVVDSGSVDIDERALESFQDKITQYTGRETVLYKTDTIKSGILTQADLQEIVQKNHRHRTPGSPNLFIVYADDFESNGDEVGRTYEDFGMVLSHGRLASLTSGSHSAFRQYVESTMLHEFGHQIGLGHNQDPNCVMNEVVESPKRAAGFTGIYTPTKFCQLELEQLEAIKNQLNN
jgi:predicted Zn-dependent protease